MYQQGWRQRSQSIDSTTDIFKADEMPDLLMLVQAIDPYLPDSDICRP
jgi:hypothetical protein